MNLTKLVLYFDGSFDFRRRKGHYGWVLKADQGGIVAEGYGDCPYVSQNLVEFHALFAGLMYLKENADDLKSMGWMNHLVFKGDYLGVFHHMNKEFTKKSSRYDGVKKYRENCLNLLKGILWTGVHIPRTKNKEAHKLSRYYRAKSKVKKEGNNGLAKANSAVA